MRKIREKNELRIKNFVYLLKKDEISKILEAIEIVENIVNYGTIDNGYTVSQFKKMMTDKFETLNNKGL